MAYGCSAGAVGRIGSDGITNVLKLLGKICLAQMIENHPAALGDRGAAGLAGAAQGRAWAGRGEPTPRLAAAAGGGATPPRGARAALARLPLGLRPFGFLAGFLRRQGL